MSKLICKNCGKEYEACPKCQTSRTFMWRNEFDSIDCFKNYMKNGGKIMRVHVEGKGYTIKEYNLKKKIYTESNGTVFKEEEIDTFILTKEDFKKLKDFKEPKQTVKKEVEGELDV